MHPAVPVPVPTPMLMLMPMPMPMPVSVSVLVPVVVSMLRSVLMSVPVILFLMWVDAWRQAAFPQFILQAAHGSGMMTELVFLVR